MFPVESPETWTEEEKKALVEFTLFHGTGERWPMTSDCLIGRVLQSLSKIELAYLMSGVVCLQLYIYKTMSLSC